MAQLQQQDKKDRSRYQHSLETLLIAEKEAELMVEDLNTAIKEHDENGLILKQEAAALRESVTNQQLSPHEPEALEPEVLAHRDKGKGKARDDDASEPTAADDSSPTDLPKTPAGEEHSTKRRAIMQRLRECHLVLHKVLFLKGDVYHVLGEKHSKDEDASYVKAEELRRKLLKCESFDCLLNFLHYQHLFLATQDGAIQAMDLVKQVGDKLTKEDMLLPVPYLDQGGIRSADLVSSTIIISGAVPELHYRWKKQMNSSTRC